MKAIRTLACAALMAASMIVTSGVATADNHTTMTPNHEMAPGVWYYRWIGPDNLEFGTPDQGTMWQKDFSGEVRYVDEKFLAIAADGSGDIMNFYLYDNISDAIPSWDAVRVGSKIQVRADDRHRVRWVKTIPFYQWLKAQTR